MFFALSDQRTEITVNSREESGWLKRCDAHAIQIATEANCLQTPSHEQYDHTNEAQTQATPTFFQTGISLCVCVESLSLIRGVERYAGHSAQY